VPNHQGIECRHLSPGERGHGFGVGHTCSTREGGETFIRARAVETVRLRAIAPRPAHDDPVHRETMRST
jgi:hypothetical protein